MPVNVPAVPLSYTGRKIVEGMAGRNRGGFPIRVSGDGSEAVDGAETRGGRASDRAGGLRVRRSGTRRQHHRNVLRTTVAIPGNKERARRPIIKHVKTESAPLRLPGPTARQWGRSIHRLLGPRLRPRDPAFSSGFEGGPLANQGRPNRSTTPSTGRQDIAPCHAC
ncbi:hypothetical protein GWK47_023688 [Chionoecetes opilio]|uniref:Uncharacterized protein n=1 Tax=Chionoecetes opilio TaxID=41210 RepID=A0A8J5BTT9_CHIOP|nr:hypothetical protein GWK47_023688 [Chionoecetes opilio]